MQKRRNQYIKPFFVFSMLLSLIVFGVAEASAEFYVISGSRGVGTEIKSLPYTISSPGFYYITKNLTCAAEVHGITISTDNVTLDLMGFSLMGPGGTGDYDGIYMSKRTNAEIRNGTVRDFQRHGIYEVTLGTGHRIVNMRVMDNGSSGIRLYSQSNIVERCTAVGNGDTGIFVYNGSTVTGNTCYENNGSGLSGGIVTHYCVTVTGNTCYNNAGCGIKTSPGSTVIGNSCYGNGNYGIYPEGNNLVDQNTATGNTVGNIRACGTCTIGINHAP